MGRPDPWPSAIAASAADQAQYFADLGDGLWSRVEVVVEGEAGKAHVQVRTQFVGRFLARTEPDEGPTLLGHTVQQLLAARGIAGDDDRRIHGPLDRGR